MSDADTIHPLRLPEPPTRAGKSVMLAEWALRIALEGRKVNIIDPRKPARAVELPAASKTEGEGES